MVTFRVNNTHNLHVLVLLYSPGWLMSCTRKLILDPIQGFFSSKFRVFMQGIVFCHWPILRAWTNITWSKMTNDRLTLIAYLFFYRSLSTRETLGRKVGLEPEELTYVRNPFEIFHKTQSTSQIRFEYKILSWPDHYYLFINI